MLRSKNDKCLAHMETNLCWPRPHDTECIKWIGIQFYPDYGNPIRILITRNKIIGSNFENCTVFITFKHVNRPFLMFTSNAIQKKVIWKKNTKTTAVQQLQQKQQRQQQQQLMFN